MTSTPPATISARAVLGGALGIAAGVLAGWLIGTAAHQGPPSFQMGQGDCPPQTLCDQAHAIEEAEAYFPAAQHPPTARVARLVTLQDAMDWLGLVVEDPADPALQQPVWIVGILADGLTISDLMPEDAPEGDRSIPGMWFVLDAIGGGLRATGGLAEPQPGYPGPGRLFTFEEIQAMTSQNLQIEPPTPFPTGTPGPSPTAPV